MAYHDDRGTTAFRTAERRFRAANTQGLKGAARHAALAAAADSLAHVIDLRNLERNTPANRECIIELPLPAILAAASTTEHADEHSITPRMERVVANARKAFALRGRPGFLFLPDAMPLEHQRYLATQSLVSYSQPPNRTNLGLVPDLWQHYVAEQCEARQLADAQLQQPGAGPRGRPPKRRASAAPPTQQHTPSVSQAAHLDKLRWITLGYHYDWTSKRYAESDVSPMPSELVVAASAVAAFAAPLYANTAGAQPTHLSDLTTYRGEAAIVNFYHSCMCARQWRSMIAFMFVVY